MYCRFVLGWMSVSLAGRKVSRIVYCRFVLGKVSVSLAVSKVIQNSVLQVWF